MVIMYDVFWVTATVSVFNSSTAQATPCSTHFYCTMHPVNVTAYLRCCQTEDQSAETIDILDFTRFWLLVLAAGMDN